jgi:hypothetical protein
MGMGDVGRGYGLFQTKFNLKRIFAWRQPGAVGDPEDMGVDGDRGQAEGNVGHHIGGLAPDPRQGFEGLAACRYFTAILIDQNLA